MGHGDETNYIYLFKASSTPTLLNQLVSSLDHSEYKIDDAEVDRTATIEFDHVAYQLPIYAISNIRFSVGDDVEGFRPVKDIKAKLKPKGAAVKFDSGVWCKPDNILDEAERTAHKGKKQLLLTHVEIELALGSKYAKLKLSVWGGAYWGGTESDPSFAKLVKPLKAMCDVWVIEDEFGVYCKKPKMKEEVQEQFGEYYQENDYFKDEGPDGFAKAILEFEPEK